MTILKKNSVRAFQCFNFFQAAITFPHSTGTVKVGSLEVLENDESGQQVSSKLNGWDAIIKRDLSSGRFSMLSVWKKRFQFVNE